jgi:hypothetical protein
MRASLRHFLTLWLTLVAALWLTRAAVSALLFQRADAGPAALFQVLALPLLQAAVLAWVTRPPAAPPAEGGFDPAAGPPED